MPADFPPPFPSSFPPAFFSLFPFGDELVQVLMSLLESREPLTSRNLLLEERNRQRPLQISTNPSGSPCCNSHGLWEREPMPWAVGCNTPIFRAKVEKDV